MLCTFSICWWKYWALENTYGLWFHLRSACKINSTLHKACNGFRNATKCIIRMNLNNVNFENQNYNSTYLGNFMEKCALLWESQTHRQKNWELRKLDNKVVRLLVDLSIESGYRQRSYMRFTRARPRLKQKMGLGKFKAFAEAWNEWNNPSNLDSLAIYILFLAIKGDIFCIR